MKRLLLVLIITLSLQSCTKADDIRDFEIEGMSIGDFALDFFIKSEIEDRKKIGFVYEKKDFYSATFYNKNFFDVYDNVQLHLKKDDETNIISNYKTETINQIKNIVQEDKDKPQVQLEVKDEKKISINSFDGLLKVCNEKKEMKLKYELEKNVSLVSFDNHRLEISFNDNLDKNFVKDLSSKLFNWTGERWIITFSKMKGDQTVKQKQENEINEFLKKAKSTDLYKQVIEKFPDANLVDVKPKNNKEE